MNAKKTADILKELTAGKGYDYIYDEAYSVHKTLIKRGIDKRTANVILYALLEEVGRDNKGDIEREVDEVLNLKKKKSSLVIEIFSSLYDEENIKKMKDDEYKGLEEFLSSSWQITSEGEATWQYKGGSKTDYSYRYTMTINVFDRNIVTKEIGEKLKKNPFLKAEEIRSYYEKEIDSIIREDFEDYCTCDDYYPPVVEDFYSNIEYDTTEYLPMHGLEMTDDEYECYEGDIYWD